MVRSDGICYNLIVIYVAERIAGVYVKIIFTGFSIEAVSNTLQENFQIHSEIG